jgi:Tfp pilus assembly protein PilF
MNSYFEQVSLSKAEALMRAGSLDSAITELRATLAQSPTSSRAHAMIAACHLDKGDPKSALASAQEALSHNHENLYAQRIEGLAYLRLNDLPKAEVALRRAVELDPESAESHRLLGVFYDSHAKLSEARSAFEEALRLDPEDGDVIASYAEFLLDKGETDNAAALIENAPDHAVSDAHLLIVRGKVAFRRGENEAARDMALWALQSDAENPAAISLLVQTKVRKNPLMAIWLGWAHFMGRFDGKTRVFILIGLWLAFNVANRTILRVTPGGVQLAASLLWIGFCLLTWIGPAVIGRMVAKELQKVRVRDF